MSVIEIIINYLEANGFDGLYSPGECACKLGDIAPCGQVLEDCEAGYLKPCPPECGDHDFHIGPKDPSLS
ncbi:hypothetical protein [Acidihalobacter yilgarnensis]|uniref:hypothetical protein n=1 Tax=Acidihalobacter yilgarnensis TaxID=2819280 RepID=UPI0012EA7C38|nr:hypothetical protein [Acidihalobacter yilgarnensis]